MIPEGGGEVGDCEVFLPREKLVERTVLEGYLYGRIAACTGQVGIDGSKVFFCEFREVVRVEAVVRHVASPRRMKKRKKSFDYTVPRSAGQC